jgi:transposase
MRCPRCGTENPPGKIVCRKCGVRLRPQTAPPLTSPGEETVVKWVRKDLARLAVVLAFLLASGTALGFLIR